MLISEHNLQRLRVIQPADGRLHSADLSFKTANYFQNSASCRGPSTNEKRQTQALRRIACNVVIDNNLHAPRSVKLDICRVCCTSLPDGKMQIAL